MGRSRFEKLTGLGKEGVGIELLKIVKRIDLQGSRMHTTVGVDEGTGRITVTVNPVGRGTQKGDVALAVKSQQHRERQMLVATPSAVASDMNGCFAAEEIAVTVLLMGLCKCQQFIGHQKGITADRLRHDTRFGTGLIEQRFCCLEDKGV